MKTVREGYNSDGVFMVFTHPEVRSVYETAFRRRNGAACLQNARSFPVSDHSPYEISPFRIRFARAGDTVYSPRCPRFTGRTTMEAPRISVQVQRAGQTTHKGYY
jgi:hypothetical protein